MNDESENAKLSKSYNTLIEKIAKKHFDVETMETRNSDSLDFYDVYIGSIRDALKESFMAGLQVGMEVAYAKYK